MMDCQYDRYGHCRHHQGTQRSGDSGKERHIHEGLGMCKRPTAGHTEPEGPVSADDGLCTKPTTAANEDDDDVSARKVKSK